MVVPSPWEFLILALGAYRLTRLIGWDDLPPIARLRGRIMGEHRYTNSTEAREPIVVYRRPVLAHFLHCPFCQGFWVCVAVYCCWLAVPKWTLVGLLVFALNAVVGLTARNLDP